MNENDILHQIYKELPTEKPWQEIKNPRTDYTGTGEAQPFPNYARTNSPEVLELWDKHQEELPKFTEYVLTVLRLMTGNPDLADFWGNGSGDTHLWVAGVSPEDIAESHRGHWKKPVHGVSKPYKKHHLYEKFKELQYRAPNFGDAPGYIFGDGLFGRPAFFKHGDHLYFATSVPGITPRNYPWYPETSPWEPIKRWEWEKAKDEYLESKDNIDD